MESLIEIKQFLDPNARLDLKDVATTHILSLTGSKDGQELLYKSTDIILLINKLTSDAAATVSKNALLSLVNLSAEPEGASVIIETDPTIINVCVKRVLDPECDLADAWAMVLSNISRLNHLVDSVIDLLQSDIRNLVSAFTHINFNQKKCHLDYLSPIFSNLSQKELGRDLFCQKGAELLQRILPFVHLSEEGSLIRKGGAIGLLKNICFDSSRHEFLLEELNVLPFILLPLAGPEEYSDDVMDTFPIELQFLGADKKRESDPDLRKMLLQSLAQLCATRKSRDFLRSHGVYEILRELHKWECTEDGDKLALLACEKVVDILIRTEEEIGEDNLKELDIPHEVLDKLDKLEE